MAKPKMKTRSRTVRSATIPESDSESESGSETSNTKDMKNPAHLSPLVMLSQQLLSIGRFNKGLPLFTSKVDDSEQLWQQLELRNSHQLSMSKCTKEVVQISNRQRFKRQKRTKEDKPNAKNSDSHSDDDSTSDSDVDNALDVIKERLAKKSEDDDELLGFGSGGDDEDEENDFDFDVDEEKSKGFFDDDENEDVKKKRKTKKKYKKSSVLDDKFFNAADMEEFLNAEDLKEEKKMNNTSSGGNKSAGDDDEDDSSEEVDNVDVDLFEEESADENDAGATAKYSDFFDPPYIYENEDGENANEDDNEDTAMDGEDGDYDEDGGDMDEDDNEEEDMEYEDEENAGKRSKKKKKVSFDKDVLPSDDENSDGGLEEPARDNEDGSDNEPSENEPKSTFETKQEKLKDKIKQMEEMILKEPSWELTGEVSSGARPENSLLETILDFQHTTRTAPIITDDTTKTLEDYIKQRIKDKTYDDVERKEKPKEDVFEFKKRIVLDQEKSKQSLAEIYEQEFVKQTQKDTDEVKADPQCEKIEKEMGKLFYQLDALCNFKYTPMKPGTEVKIIVNTPAITMEEVAPVATTDADMLAPEEVMKKKKGDLKADEERDETDKKRARRQKKTEQREKKKAKEARERKVEKMKLGLGNKYSKMKAMKQLEDISKSDKNVSLIKGEGKRLTSSKAFFTELQDEVTTQVKAAKASKMEKKRKMDASKLIL